MWDLIVSGPGHCLSFYFAWVVNKVYESRNSWMAWYMFCEDHAQLYEHKYLNMDKPYVRIQNESFFHSIDQSTTQSIDQSIILLF